MTEHTGSCHCGSVVFKVPEELGDVRYCYCQTCRKLNGSAFSAVAMIPSEEFELLQGAESIGIYESTPGKQRHHCTKCFAPLYVQLKSDTSSVRLRLGLMNFEPKVTLRGHIWVSEKPEWYTILDDLPQAAEF